MIITTRKHRNGKPPFSQIQKQCDDTRTRAFLADSIVLVACINLKPFTERIYDEILALYVWQWLSSDKKRHEVNFDA